MAEPESLPSSRPTVRDVGTSAAAGLSQSRAAIRANLAQRARWRWFEVMPWVLITAAFFALPDYLAFGTQILITIIFALSIDLIVGFAGVVSLGHAAFFGVGAYAAGMASAHLGWTEPVSSLLLAGTAAGIAGLISGVVLLRYHGLTLLMLTMATAIFLLELANANAGLTGGFDGLVGVSFDPLLGVFEYDLWGRTHYVFAAVVLLLVFVFCRRLVHSGFGRSLVGIRENTARMHALGAPVYWRLVAVYTISAIIAGIAGGLFAQANTYVTLDVLSFARSGTILIIIVLGGTGRLYGAFVGAVVFLVLEDELAKLSPQFWEFGVGLVLVLVVMFARGGILGALDKLFGRRS